MGLLTIVKAYQAEEILLEAHLDYFRDGLLTLINTDKLDASNFSGSMTLSSTKFTGNELTSADDTYINFGNGSEAIWGLDSGKDYVFDTATATTAIRFYAGDADYLEVKSDRVNVPGDIIYANAQNGGGSILHNLGTYKKPVLKYISTTTIDIEANAGTNSTTIYFPSGAITVTEDTSSTTKYRRALTSATSNGYESGDTGAADSGMRQGISVSASTWYYVYAAKVIAGSDYSASAGKFVLVIDTTAPTPANESTLNSRYTADNWVYMGSFRRGFGATGSTTEIIPFVQSRHGWCMFTAKSSSGYGGLNLAYSTTDADNTSTALYTISNADSGNAIPTIFGHIMLNLARERVSNWYIKVSTSGTATMWQSGWQTDDDTLPHGFVVTLGNISGNGVYQSRKGTNAGTARAVVLMGYCDTYMVHRKYGHGV